MANHWLALPAFAKANLSLEFLGCRSDGYWEIRTVYQTLTLHDRLRLRLTRTGHGVAVRVPGGGAPRGRANIVHRIVTRARRWLGLRAGVEVELEKNIPTGAGLGGGSSDAAAALLGLLRLCSIRCRCEELSRLAAEVGADIPFFFLGGRALGVGRGEEVYPLEDAQPALCVLVCPFLPISTRAAYGWVARAPRALTPRRGVAKIAGSGSQPEGFWPAGNDFEPVVFSRFPQLARIKAAMLRAGARRAGLSGSGSTVYALFSRRADAVQAAARWGSAASVFLVETLARERYQRALQLGRVCESG